MNAARATNRLFGLCLGLPARIHYGARMQSSERSIHTYKDDRCTARRDVLALEEPLSIRAHGKSLAVLMRTPGHDRELVRGLLNAEGVLRGEEFALVQRDANEVELALDEELLAARWASRDTISSSACGVCGAAALAVLEELAEPIRSDLRWTPSMVTGAPVRLREEQELFDKTGGLHGAALFDAAGELVVCREDVGRHNAVDKIVGWSLEQATLVLSEHVLVVSGRLSYEIVHKAVAAGIPMIVAVSAPSSLAVDLAERWRVTLAGFVRGGGFNVYSHPGRIVVA